MMSGYADGAPASVRPLRPRRYRVRACKGGWCVAVNGCRTGALADREAAAALAGSLQAEADRLTGRRKCGRASA